MIKLSKQFSRERSLFYFYLWNDSDKRGYLKWLGYKIKNNLFLRSGKENKISVWYENKEIEKMFQAISKGIKKDHGLLNKLKRASEKEWNFIKHYIIGRKRVKDAKAFKKYYRSIVRWWSAMTIIWYIPDIESINEKTRNDALRMRRETEMYSARFNYIFEDYFKKYFPEYKKYLHVVSPKEVFILKDRKFNQREIGKLEKRLSGFGLFNEKIYTLKNLSKELKKKQVLLKDERVELVKEIKGNIASSGRARGKVRLVLNKKIIADFKKGEVLVTEMTDPDFILAMKKASAIITDEGGIASHAAIVARELKKPCIIGTKIATQVLKDGDLVEVDADKGIVKILKKA